MDRSARPDDGSPARLIAAMVGIVGILLLGSLAWSAVASLVGALGEATAVITNRATPTRLAVGLSTPSPTARPAATPGSAPTAGSRADTAESAPTPRESAPALRAATPATPAALETPTPPPATPTAAPNATPGTRGRAPWILLPRPEPDSRVAPGSLLIEVRGRGDAPITAIRLELDGAPLPVSLEQRSESTWRGFASARVAAGQHVVRAAVIDEEGRGGSYRWTFEAAP